MQDHISLAAHQAANNFALDANGVFARELAFLVKMGQKIDAIKKTRAAIAEFGLKEAKDFVEAFAEKIQNYGVANGSAREFHNVFETVRRDARDREFHRLREDVLSLRQRLVNVTEERDEFQRLYQNAIAERDNPNSDFGMGVAYRQSEGIPCTDPHCTTCECD